MRYLRCACWIAIFGIGMSVGGCATPDADPARGTVKGTVMRYNQLLASCYQALDMNPMQEVATAEQAEKLYHHMAALGEGQVRMKSALQEIAFESVEFPAPDRCRVRTRELWDFSHEEIGSGKTVMRERNFAYRLDYELRKEDRQWIVTSVVARDTDPAPPARM